LWTGKGRAGWRDNEKRDEEGSERKSASPQHVSTVHPWGRKGGRKGEEGNDWGSCTVVNHFGILYCEWQLMAVQ